MATTDSRRRGRPPAGESPTSVEDILLAALRAFAERGYEGMSVREVTQQLGVSHNLLFQRFGRKDELWRAVIDRYFGSMHARMMEIVAEAKAQNTEPLAAFRHLIVEFIEANAARPELLRLMSVEASTDSDRLAYLFERYIAPSSKQVASLLEPLVRAGVVRDLPPATFFFLVAHGATGPAGHAALAAKLGEVHPSDPDVARRHAEAVADVLLTGIVNTPPVASKRSGGPAKR